MHSEMLSIYFVIVVKFLVDFPEKLSCKLMAIKINMIICSSEQLSTYQFNLNWTMKGHRAINQQIYLVMYIC